jgi:glycosyltransferase involved in cell wall biosynthesis
MKILTLNFNLKGIGTYRRSFYFSRELARGGHDVTMVTVSSKSKCRSRIFYKRDWVGESPKPAGPGPWVRLVEGAGLGYKFLPGWGSGPLDIAWRIAEIARGGYDAVYGFEHHPNVSWPVYATRSLLGYRFYSDWCDWYAGSSNHMRGWKTAHRIDGFFEEQIRYRARKVTVTSRVLEERALKLGIPKERVIRIPEGAATDYIEPLPQDEARQRCGLPLDRPVVAAVRTAEMERELLVFAKLLRHVPDALLLMIGATPSGAMQRAQELGIFESIVPAGWVSDEAYPQYLACADVLFCPLDPGLNDRARWPAKILDYLSAGRPVVINDVGEAGELFRERNVGVLAGQADEEMAHAIAGLLRDRGRAKFLADSARRVMVEEWDWRRRGPLISQVVAS